MSFLTCICWARSLTVSLPLLLFRKCENVYIFQQHKSDHAPPQRKAFFHCLPLQSECNPNSLLWQSECNPNSSLWSLRPYILWVLLTSLISFPTLSDLYTTFTDNKLSVPLWQLLSPLRMKKHHSLCQLETFKDWFALTAHRFEIRHSRPNQHHPLLTHITLRKVPGPWMKKSLNGVEEEWVGWAIAFQLQQKNLRGKGEQGLACIPFAILHRLRGNVLFTLVL